MTKSPKQWTADAIAIETYIAELHKGTGYLPVPRSSWDLTPSPNDGGISFAKRLDAA